MRYSILVILLGYASLVSAAEVPISIPSDSRALYVVLEKGGRGDERIIVTKRVGSSGTSYSRRVYNCRENTVKYLGTGDTLAAMNSSSPDPRMGPIVEGSIAYYVGRYACN
jgi:hypothetical protein